jgi:hypothetical protein
MQIARRLLIKRSDIPHVEALLFLFPLLDALVPNTTGGSGGSTCITTEHVFHQLANAMLNYEYAVRVTKEGCRNHHRRVNQCSIWQSEQRWRFAQHTVFA